MPSLITISEILRCSLIAGIFLMLAACGDLSEESSATGDAPTTFPAPAPGPVSCDTSSALFSSDLAGQCRASPLTMGALEAT